LGEGRQPIERTTHPRPPTAVVLDQYSVWLDAVKGLAARAGVSVVAATTQPDEAIAALETRQPNIFVLGLERTPTRADVLRDLTRVASDIAGLVTLVVSDDDDPEFIEQCFASGVYAYVLKTVQADDFAAAIRQAVDRSVYLFTRPAQNGGADVAVPDAPRLTARELQVLTLVAEGLPNAQVAKRLWISEPTVKYHLSRTYEKLGVSNRTGAARWADRRGLLREAQR
jgi:DNA-binding NarL/FixJ family response regulator